MATKLKVVNDPQTPEELAALIAELETKKTKALADMKAARERSVADAVGKAGVDFEEKFGEYIKRQKQIDEDRERLAENTKFLNEQYKAIRDQLVSAGAKEEYLADVIGQPPSAAKVKVAGATGTGTKGKRTKWQLPDGTVLSSVEFSKKYGITLHEGANQRPFVEAAIASRADLQALGAKLIQSE